MGDEVSKWQMIDVWMPFLIKMYETIREAYQFEQYDIAFKDMEQIIVHIHMEIKNMKGGEERLNKIKTKIEEVYKIKNSFKLFEMQMDMPDEYIFEEASKKKTELRIAVTDLYYMITSAISDLNMFMPKTKIDTRLPIYKG